MAFLSKNQFLRKGFVFTSITLPMSNYGPAFFIARNDNKAMEKKEQAQLLQLVSMSCRKNNIFDDQGNPVLPSLYDYNGVEKNAIGFLIYSSTTYSLMPEDAKQDQLKADRDEIRKIEAEIDKAFPKVYSYKCYYVED